MKTNRLVKAGLLTALTAAGGFVRIPLGPVPLTLQSFFVLLSGLTLGPRLGAASQLAYILLGLAGLPIFASGGGLGYIWQPSFGYLLGFVLAAWVTGSLANRPGGSLTPGRALGAVLAGTAAVYVVGLPYLYLAAKYFAGRALPWPTVVKAGILIFLPGDVLKATVLSFLAPRLRGLPNTR